MTFTCHHFGKSSVILLGPYKNGEGNKWFRDCTECGEKLNWSPALKAWMSEADWREYRNNGRTQAGLDPE